MESRTLLAVIAFFLGCITSATFVLNFALTANESNNTSGQASIILPAGNPKLSEDVQRNSVATGSSSSGPLEGTRILIAIAAFDFSQLPHLEEVLDAYQDLCVTGAAKVDVVIHSTVAYPVTLIDLLNTRLVPACQGIFSVKIVLKSPSLRLHLVDCHRPLFYEKIKDYDLFIYTEDDIRVTPRAVAAYAAETNRLVQTLGAKRAADFNVGIVRYEFNYPSNVVMDDKTRHATQNVTRVYWEHGMYPVIPKAVDAVPDTELKETHVHMRNHHQGMYLATSDLLKAWKDRPGCEFDIVQNRPGWKNRPSQPSEGTQRVWMSSQQLYGKGHCNVQQVIPVDSFGTLTVLHLPNKNYRRVGHFRNRTFSDGTEQFDFGASGSLLTAMRLHLELRNVFKQIPKKPYYGIEMIDEVKGGRTPLLERRMGEYQAYADRGGILSEEDMTKTDLVEEK
jgi:hypothetical protein